MIKNEIIRKVKIIKGNNFFMLSKGYESDLDKLPKDVLKNMYLKLKEENIYLKNELKQLRSAIDAEFATHGR